MQQEEVLIEEDWRYIYGGSIDKDDGSGAKKILTRREKESLQPIAVERLEDNVEFYIGDCVLVESNVSAPYVAIIKSFEFSSEGFMEVELLWFQRPEDIRKESKRRSDVMPQEVYITWDTDRNPLDVLEDHAQVLSMAAFEKNFPTFKVPLELREKVFFCRYGCNTTHLMFSEELNWGKHYRGRNTDIDELFKWLSHSLPVNPNLRHVKKRPHEDSENEDRQPEKIPRVEGKRGPGRPPKVNSDGTPKRGPGRPPKLNPDGTPKRGPGRPPKVTVNPDGTPKRGPGRPPKVDETTTPQRRGPGRPRKDEHLTEEAIESSDESDIEMDQGPPSEEPVKRGPGRPLKAAESLQPELSDDDVTLISPQKRGPGRPRKYPIESAEESPAKRGPGRPRKYPIESAEPSPQKRGPGRPPKSSYLESPKRGPGRPPKEINGDALIESPKRGPGRPPKSSYELESPKRGPGRPPKGSYDVPAESPKRGPGRPPKSSYTEAESTKRGPGRPPKSSYLLESPKRGPGRPPKDGSLSPVKRGPGRPRKDGSVSPTKRGPGRPRKDTSVSPAKRGPGRPRKYATEEERQKRKLDTQDPFRSDDDDNFYSDAESIDYEENSESELESEIEEEDDDQSDFDDLELIKRTPSKRNIAKKQAYTNKKRFVKEPLEVVSLPKRITMSAEQSIDPNASPHKYARNKLHVAAVPDSLPCRENEFSQIYLALESAIYANTGSCVYISGTPGTGKTATVREVVSQLQHQSDEGDLPDFSFLEINGMKLIDPHTAYEILWQEVSGGQRVSASHAMTMLEKEFKLPNPRRIPIVVLMDELDQLVTRNQGVMYNFFNWPTFQHARLIVVAVANTMDLPERMLSNKISSRLGLTRIQFPGYTHNQLREIIASRLQGIPGNIVERDAMEFAARKIASVSGDARRALDICRRSVEIAESEAKEGNELPKVTIMHVRKAITESTSSPISQYLKGLAISTKVVVCAIMSRVRRSGLIDNPLSDILDDTERLVKLSTYASDLMGLLYDNRVRMAGFVESVAELSEAGVIVVQNLRGERNGNVRLVVNETDVADAFKNDPDVKGMI
ncbi:hypothetical protein TRVA0_001S02740 [Trichomonascus vanleenenianus]|uniref:uncharacterized protein n=1 Tax=Trichomonascus vanleenenianus TaxID=2268995 RepID=UPI003ECB2D4D